MESLGGEKQSLSGQKARPRRRSLPQSTFSSSGKSPTHHSSAESPRASTVEFNLSSRLRSRGLPVDVPTPGGGGEATDPVELEEASRALLRREMAQTRALRESLRQLAVSKRSLEMSLPGGIASARVSPSAMNRLAYPTTPERIKTTGVSQVRASSSPKLDQANSREFESQLRAFYARENPTKMEMVPTLVAQHVGLKSENKLKIRLLRKYGHTTKNSVALAWHFALPVQHKNRHHSTASPSLLDCTCIFCVAAQLPDRDDDDDRKAFVSEVIHFYERHNPEKLSSNDPSLSKMVMASKDAEELDLAVIKVKLLLKYHCFPTITTGIEVLKECKSPLHKCISRFYLRWNPSKAADAASVIEMYSGERETELKFKLLCKYQLLPVSPESGQIACDLLFDNDHRTVWKYDFGSTRTSRSPPSTRT